jgi:NADH dehydrogenase
MILVVGATGFLGSEICRRLRAQDRPVRALVRHTADPARLDNLKQSGAELAFADLKERASLAAACQGVEAVVTTVSTTFSRQPGDSIEATDRDGQLALVEAARQAGVPRFVYTSYSGTIDKVPNPCPLTVAKRMVEQALQASGMAYTILRPTFYMEIWLSPFLGFDPANAKATIYGKGDKPVSFISLQNVAEFAIQSLDSPAARNAVLTLGGPQALTPLEAVGIFEKAAGRSFELSYVPEEALADQRATATDSLSQSFAALMLSFSAGDPIPMAQMAKTFPIALIPVQAYAEKMLAPA